ncbi:Quinonprotein alcohol dehydrogenase-like domain-containing protein [Dioscorea alata]|uniref:Quinonprotein alcohol dehydrogenase-like domain-containing protein n=1 Tax=Dioscorea alata TaxID=55571 RepID=A0ACB7U148_DIOAL|nr:Quinonprotein alcohol dehydrogenase-like domain-containing protein [Dioscorea alata]
MCPLRVVLIFLSATLAGFFLLRGLKAQPDQTTTGLDLDANESSVAMKEPLPVSTKVRSAACSVFWTCVDMASGRYLWRTLRPSSSSSSSSSICSNKKD